MTRASAALDALARGELTAPAALVSVIGATADLAGARAALVEAERRLGPTSVASASRLLTPETFDRVKAVLASVDHDDAQATPATLAAAFDRAVEVSPEAGVALYSLGDAALLAAATAEVAEWIGARGLLGLERRMLEVGCGIGRFLVALAPKLELAVGLDVSRNMAAEAGRRCAGLGNAVALRTSGRDLACVGDGSIDLVLFADSFPYLVQVGAGLPESHLAECSRVLRAGGRVLILNYSYRGDRARDAAEASALARAHGLVPQAVSARPFRGWDAHALLFSAP